MKRMNERAARQGPQNAERSSILPLNEPVLLALIASFPIEDVIAKTRLPARDLARLRDRFEL